MSETKEDMMKKIELVKQGMSEASKQEKEGSSKYWELYETWFELNAKAFDLCYPEMAEKRKALVAQQKDFKDAEMEYKQAIIGLDIEKGSLVKPPKLDYCYDY